MLTVLKVAKKGNDATLKRAPERRDSVTLILQSAADYCRVSTPRHRSVKSSPDCWEETDSKFDKGTKSPPEGSTDDATASCQEPKPVGRKTTLAGSKSEAPIELKELPTLQTKPLSTTKRKDSVFKSGTDKSKEQLRNKKKIKKEEDAEPSEQIRDSYEKIYDLMVGSSEVYSATVEILRKSCGRSEVLLGLPDTQPSDMLNEDELSKGYHLSPSPFTIAVAAAKLRLNSARANASGRGRGRGLNANSQRNDRPKGGKKVFEDAFISTWSQPILSANKQGFSITFEEEKKPRIVRISRLRRKSVTMELPKAKEEEGPKDEAEWMEWRRVHDRVNNWLTDNSQVEPDESHIIAMLMEPDQKRSIFL